MLGMTHVVVGAAVGKSIANPIVAFTAGLASHLLIDKLPHFWPRTKKAQNIQIYTDLIGTVLLFIIYLFWPLPNKANIFWGAFGGAIIDIIFVIIPMIYPRFMDNKFRVWHENRQKHFHSPVYLFTDILISIISLVLILV